MTSQGHDTRIWRRLNGLSEVLAFASKERRGASFSTWDEPAEIRREHCYKLIGEQQEFTDGSALVILSGREATGHCDTCAGSDAVVFYYAREPQ